MAGCRVLYKKSFVLDLTLILLLLYLVYVFLNLDANQKLTYFSISKSEKSRSLIWSRRAVKNKPPDYRPLRCITKKYELTRKASLISHFNNFQLYDLKIAIASAIYKSEDYIGEVIIIDDGSNDQDILEEAQKYFDELFVQIILLRNEVQLGVAKSLKKALDEAKYDDVVIFNPSIICSVGWLFPLLDEVSKNPKSIVVPHFDKVSDLATGRYERVDDNYVASILWNLQTVLIKTNTSADQTSPGIRPDFLAAKRSFLNSIGSVDEDFGFGGGEMLELAMRTWCCGGSIKMVACSRVAVGNFHNPIKIASGINFRRIVGLWFQNNSDIYMPLSRNFQPTDHELDSIRERKKLFSSLNCNGARWYFKEILKKPTDLNSAVIRFGHLKARSGLCAEVAPDLRINMISCEFDSRDQNTFQLTSNKHLLVAGKCLTAKQYSYVKLEECQDNQNQRWEFNNKLELFNIGAGSCATHVTDPYQPTSFRQIVMAQNCVHPTKEDERFKQWTFVAI